MSLLDQFPAALDKMDGFLSQATAINNTLTDAKQRELYGQALALAKKARLEMETAVPAAAKAIEETKQNAIAGMTKSRAGLPALKQRSQELKQTATTAAAKVKQMQANMKKLPAKPSVKGIKMPPAWGDQLKDELLNKFGNLPSAPVSAPRDAAIWADWQWNSDRNPMGEG
ncbi:hypothetical protein [Blastopirellula marina]|uniref:Uncharacterized protein n=1 Tax=Blastopirellula marina DSM 3645 TaxID=314230 RepID=A3ZN26_9BACT|nr:hypothetical protein [Blastopirellula marina]EAQ82355.1 hypothetical protein DSM3645_01535 [Blastopirellula marina DSM 3645]